MKIIRKSNVYFVILVQSKIQLHIISCWDVQISGISKRETSKYDEKISTTAFSSSQFTHAFNHLHKITLNDFKEVEVLFDLERPSINRELITTQQPLHLFPCLEDLVLWHMDTLSHVWKCSNWNEFFIIHKHQPQSSFQNLTTITVRGCKSLKYLFSPRMCKLLSNLKTISIVNSKVMEEVISNIDEEDEVLTMSATTLFPHLHNLDLDDLYNLKRIGGCVAKGTNDVIHDQFKFCEAGVVSWSLCQYAIEMNIGRCVALSSVVPSCAAGQMQKLQVLNIRYCRSLVEVFATKERNNNNTSGCSSNSSNVDQGIHTTLPFLRPKNITMHELSNLKMLKICYCDLLEYIFTFSTLESLKKLEKLSIKGCKGMKVIVREENGEASSTKAVVVFPRLKSIELEYLPNLAGFFLGMNNNFHWPSLDYVMITDCPQMTVFTSGDSTTLKLTYVHTWLGKHNLECGLNFHQIPSPSSDSPSLCHAITKGSSWSLHNLIEMDVHDNANLKKIIPSNELQNLETIYIYRCDSVEEVFEVTSGVTNNESQTVVKFPKLREVKLDYLKRLKYIWGSNHRSILEFPKLTKLSINGCDHLEHVLTPSMIGSLMQLQELHVRHCLTMEVIVKEEEECDHIMFPCLKSLKLKDLSSLKGFCLGKEKFTLPLLNKLVVKQCPEIRSFTKGRSIAPELKLVKTSFGIFHAGEDINSVIMTK